MATGDQTAGGGDVQLEYVVGWITLILPAVGYLSYNYWKKLPNVGVLESILVGIIIAFLLVLMIILPDLLVLTFANKLWASLIIFCVVPTIFVLSKPASKLFVKYKNPAVLDVSQKAAPDKVRTTAQVGRIVSDCEEAIDADSNASNNTDDNISLTMLIEDLKPLAALWKNFAIYLNFKDAEINRIESDSAGASSRTTHCFNGVMSAWFNGPKEKQTAQILAKAVEHCDYRNLANEIREKEKRGTLNMTQKEISALLIPVQHKYQTLATFLKVPTSTVKKLEKFAGDCSTCLETMLEIYIREKNPEVDSLVKAIANVQMKNLSQELMTKYQGKSFEKFN